MLSDFLFRLLLHSFCIVLYVVRVPISFSLNSVLYGSLCCSSFYFTSSHYRSVWLSIFSEFLCDLVSLPLCMGLYVDLVSMSLGFTFVLCRCPIFYLAWFRIRSMWVSMLFEFLFQLVLLPFCIGLYFVRFSVTWSHLRSV